MKLLVTAICFATATLASAQHSTKTTIPDNWKKLYRASETKINNLVHTKVEAKFDYKKQYLYGKVWITLTPHFYPTDSLKLDAKGMNINEVAIVKGSSKKALTYTYDSLKLAIMLDKTYKKGEQYMVYIDYTAKPNELSVQGSAAIQDAKGLYFINPDGSDKTKPTQIWTQGETEATSAWCPTIDATNQKTTNEIIMTVDKKYVTLSNGKLVSQKVNADGTRTDHWKMELPHAPYLFFMGVGDYAVVKDTYKGKEVNYYVEKEYEKVARKIYGNTPEMMAFFSKITGVEYPWVKYSQMTARDYVSGAMENTTATLHTDKLQQNARELVDGNKYEDYVAHELFHQWFGDLVTAESWSNLTVNESFANYSEVLWTEYKYGKEAGDAKNLEDMQGYLQSRSESKDLVRFIYKDKEDMFDAVSYNKGGRILHMLRSYLGDSAFFAAINNYLVTNKLKTGEAHQLRLAAEEVSGQDLNWFFNQWYFGNGHPKLTVNYGYDANKKMATVAVKQTQAGDKIFKLPTTINVYDGATKNAYKVWLNNKQDSFSFPCNNSPALIDIDAERVLLAEITDNKSLENFIFQYNNAPSYRHKLEALEYCNEFLDEEVALNLVKKAISDKNKKIRIQALKTLNGEPIDAVTEKQILSIATTDKDMDARADAIALLKQIANANDYKTLFVKGLTDSSYTVAGASLTALAELDEAAAIAALPMLKKDMKNRLEQAVKTVEVLTKTDEDFDAMFKDFSSSQLFEKFEKAPTFISYLGKVNNTANFKKAVDAVLQFNKIANNFSPEYANSLKKALGKVATKKTKLLESTNDKSTIQEQINYLNEKLK